MTATSSRKLDHLRICNEDEVECGRTGFEDVHLLHNALPECDMERIDLSAHFLDFRLRSPLFIAAMTGGHPGTKEINRRLAAAAERFGIGMGVGSQRAALENSALADSFTVVRETAPHAFLCANLGIAQLRDHGVEWAENAVEMIEAQALVIHLNFLQEAIQPEGDHRAEGCLEALRILCQDFPVPVLVKETGAGISEEVARRILGAGAQAIDISGSGGTSWAAVEMIRAAGNRTAGMGRVFTAWGIPTVVSLVETVRTGAPCIATGGLRTGIDVAKSLSLGAHLGGMALPLFRAGMSGENVLTSKIEEIHQQLRTAMFLTGSRTIADLRSVRPRITGLSREMLERPEREEEHGY
ncbi:MAG: type 2 isopentenyl-diphosphate Delta-isomerase [Methanomicrobiales archaeon]|nr:type 2 isopentenyl-diphosphate Delta-isomerase [Methanomicrobiales archaeon]